MSSEYLGACGTPTAERLCRSSTYVRALAWVSSVSSVVRPLWMVCDRFHPESERAIGSGNESGTDEFSGQGQGGCEEESTTLLEKRAAGS